MRMSFLIEQIRREAELIPLSAHSRSFAVGGRGGAEFCGGGGALMLLLKTHHMNSVVSCEVCN